MSEYTPGPWKVLNNTRGYPYQIYAPNSSGGPGGIKSITRGAAITLPSSDEGKANARLIAAAPAMLEALKEIEKAEGAFSMDAYEHACNSIESMREIARTAIAAAETETGE